MLPYSFRPEYVSGCMGYVLAGMNQEPGSTHSRKHSNAWRDVFGATYFYQFLFSPTPSTAETAEPASAGARG